jgi:hypothetical protein
MKCVECLLQSSHSCSVVATGAAAGVSCALTLKVVNAKKDNKAILNFFIGYMNQFKD